MQHQQVGALDLAGHHVGQPARRQALPQRAAHEARRQIEQLPRQVVGQHDPFVLVVSEDAFPDAVQHGLPFLEQRRDLAELQAERLPLEPAGQAERRQDAEGEDGEEIGGQAGQRAGHLPGHRGGVRKPTETSPIRRPWLTSGALPTASMPRVPCWTPIHSRPVRKGSLEGGS